MPRLMMSMPEVRVLGSVDRDLLEVLVRKLHEEGLTEAAKHFALLVTGGGRSLLEVAFVDRTGSFSDDVVTVVEWFLQTMASQVAWTERLQTQGRDPRDVLEALERGKKRDHGDGCVASSTAARAFKPKMRVTWAPAAAGASRLSEVGRVCYDRGAKRGTDLLRLRVRSWESFTRWLMWWREKRWFGSTVDVVDYVAEKMFRGLPGVVRREIGLAWEPDAVQRRGGQEALGERHGWSGGRQGDSGQGTAVSLGSDRGSGACGFPRGETISFEGGGLGTSGESLWVLRMDDMQRTKPADVEWMESGLIAKLKRTKTTGPGKAIGVLRVFIPEGTCVVDRAVLLGCGQESGLLPRSCHIRLPGFSEKHASTGDLAGMGMRMLMELEVPEKKDNMWCSTGVKMLNEISAAGFTRHSERATMPSILAALGSEQSRS